MSRHLALGGILAALLFAAQAALAFLPNIELVSLLVILYTLFLGKRVVPVLLVFALLEGLLYGFGLWWVSYLYVWPLLAGLAALLKRAGASPFAYAILSGGFGLSFGLLCAIPYLAGGPGAALAWWIAGIPFDLVHGAGNLVLALVLFVPLHRLFSSVLPRIQS